MRSQGVIFLRRDGFDFYEDRDGRILNFPFSQGVVFSLEIINLKELKNQIKTFVETNKLSRADLMIILLADVLFEKNIQDQDPKTQAQEVQKFLVIIPFESISTKILPIQQGVRAIAVNKNLLDALKISFEEFGFSIEGMVPYEFLGELSSGINSVTTETSKTIIKQFDSLKEASFEFERNEKKTASQVESQVGKNKPKSLRLYIILGIFGLLLLILIFLIFTGR